MAPPRQVTVRVDGVALRVPEGASVAAAIECAAGGVPAIYRRSLRGTPRGACCGMGVCKECRVTIDGVPNRLACEVRCSEGMEIGGAGTGDGTL